MQLAVRFNIIQTLTMAIDPISIITAIVVIVITNCNRPNKCNCYCCIVVINNSSNSQTNGQTNEQTNIFVEYFV